MHRLMRYLVAVKDRVTLQLPRGAQILGVEDGLEYVSLVAMVDTETFETDEIQLRVVSIGTFIPDAKSLRFIGQAKILEGKLPLYIFEAPTVEEASDGN